VDVRRVTVREPTISSETQPAPAAQDDATSAARDQGWSRPITLLSVVLNLLMLAALVVRTTTSSKSTPLFVLSIAAAMYIMAVVTRVLLSLLRAYFAYEERRMNTLDRDR
jgi:hypothetical protein